MGINFPISSGLRKFQGGPEMNAIIDVEGESDIQMITPDFDFEIREVECGISFPETLKFVTHVGCGSMYLRWE